jgi:Leucine-rich repeat (LRR) protein
VKRLILLLIALAAPALAQPAALLEALKAPQSATSLQLAGLGLEKVPAEVLTLSNLQQLVLNENRLSALPDLARLTRLEVLWVAGNRIASWSLPPSLKDLDLGRNALGAVPAPVWELGSLRVLSLRQNHLDALPRDVSRLAFLEVLDLSRNRLTTVPTELSLLKHLRVLDLTGNPITLPEQTRLKGALPGVDVTF